MLTEYFPVDREPVAPDGIRRNPGTDHIPDHPTRSLPG